MKFLVMYGEDVVGLYTDMAKAWEAVDLEDDVAKYRIIIIGEENSWLEPSNPKTINIAVAWGN